MAKLQIKLRFFEAKALLLLFIGLIVSRFSKKEDHLWLFSERGTDARDNGFWMFRYVCENHPEINAKYIISKESADRELLLKWESRLIEFESIQHNCLLWNAEYLVSTHLGGCLPYLIRHVHLFKHIYEKIQKPKIVLLQHGITKDNMYAYHANRTLLHTFICGAQPEYEYIRDNYGFTKDVVKYTGMARYDGLFEFRTISNQILIMPTWRSWLRKESFLESSFFNSYKSLLQNKDLHELLIKNDLKLFFYPHYEVQPFIENFKKLSLIPNIIIADKSNYDVQQLLKESAFLITDYSSVFFDFAYMKKPLLYYQFDESEYRSKHYAIGYFDYHDGLGEWIENEDELINRLKVYIDSRFKMPKKYIDKVDSFFPLRDTNNCLRVFETIMQIK